MPVRSELVYAGEKMEMVDIDEDYRSQAQCERDGVEFLPSDMQACVPTSQLAAQLWGDDRVDPYHGMPALVNEVDDSDSECDEGVPAARGSGRHPIPSEPFGSDDDDVEVDQDLFEQSQDYGNLVNLTQSTEHAFNDPPVESTVQENVVENQEGEASQWDNVEATREFGMYLNSQDSFFGTTIDEGLQTALNELGAVIEQGAANVETEPTSSDTLTASVVSWRWGADVEVLDNNNANTAKVTKTALRAFDQWRIETGKDTSPLVELSNIQLARIVSAYATQQRKQNGMEYKVDVLKTNIQSINRELMNQRTARYYDTDGAFPVVQVSVHMHP